MVHDYDLMECFTHILARFAKDLKQKALDTILIVLESETWDEERPHVNKIKEAGLVCILQYMAKDTEFRSEAEPILKCFSVENPIESESETENEN